MSQYITQAACPCGTQASVKGLDRFVLFPEMWCRSSDDIAHFSHSCTKVIIFFIIFCYSLM